ncbi:hypothetical protein Kuja_0800 [Vibrio phage vB_VchM_Kuja]|uniref:Coil containing protein n=1 Tax=Vibrio phage vB_VchM_Kuja TaxID=2686437 RepID=A0A6B9J5D2_9CAUD|nr:hypothetical protein HWC83_gp156 [Vibrio phage vB_VchM_Kuja]QGZ16071.1 hypothetical protein Kuja_0800 [Vibrio phage vB_VchM_Kuja]
MKNYEIRSNNQGKTVGIYRRSDGSPVVVRNFSWFSNNSLTSATKELNEIMEILEQEKEYEQQRNSK